MNILIVDGNEKEASDKYKEMGMDTQYEVYSKIIDNLSNNKFNTIVVHPAFKNDYLPYGVSLDDFDGIAWTGSVLNIYDMTPSIINQIELAKKLFTKKNKIFGSCWGLQVLVNAAGGIIRKNPKGLEAVVAKNIEINENGLNHKLYKGKNKNFDAFCWHYDETESLPENSIVLASNQKSDVQSIYFEKNNCSVWAVQYHPEFNPTWIAGLMQQRKEILLKENIFKNNLQFEAQQKFFFNYKKSNDKVRIKKYADLIDSKYHTLELENWLNEIKS